MVVGGTLIDDDDDIGPSGSRDKKLSVSSFQKPPNIIYLMTVLSAMGGFLFGYDTGIVGGAMVFVKQKFELDDVWHEVIVGITILSAWLFSFAAGNACDSYGRKRVILWASIVFTVGSIIMGIAQTKYILLIGRFIVGIAIGLASTAVPIYIAEVAPSNIRGSLVTLNNCFITFGQLAAAVTAGAFSYDKRDGWRWMLALASVPAIIQFIGFIFMPESPRWLLRQERSEEALKSLKRIRGEKNPYVLREFDKIRQNTNELKLQEEKRKDQNKNLLVTILARQGTRRALTLGCFIMMAQQLAGINTVMYYTPTIIQMSGIQSDSAAVWLAVPTAVVYVIFSICGCLIADRMNRRTLLLGSLMGVMVCLIILGGGFHLNTLRETSANVSSHDSTEPEVCWKAANCAACIDQPACGFCFNPEKHGDPTLCLEASPDAKYSKRGQCSVENTTDSHYVFARRLCPQMNDGISKTTWMVLSGLVLYLAFFAPGMAPMPWTINSEIYPMWARSSCYSIATSINWLTNMIVSFTFMTLSELWSKHSVFYMYAILSGIFWIYIFFYLPETRGRSLDDIEHLFTKTKKPRDDQNMIGDDDSPGDRPDSQDSVNFDQLAMISTQMGTGGHRHSIVMCHEDFVLAAESLTSGLAKQQQQEYRQASNNNNNNNNSNRSQQVTTTVPITTLDKQNHQKAKAIAGAAAAAEELVKEAANKLASPLGKHQASQTSLGKLPSQSQHQQVTINELPKRKYSIDGQTQTNQNQTQTQAQIDSEQQQQKSSREQ